MKVEFFSQYPLILKSKLFRILEFSGQRIRNKPDTPAKEFILILENDLIISKLLKNPVKE